MNPISGPSFQAARLGSLPSVQGGGDAKESAFKDMLISSIREVSTLQQDADRAVEAMSVGGDVQPAEVLTAVQKADMAFRMMMQMRNKLVDAYQEIQNIRI
jgi:flagellar hook-basal body complex protein FliE